MSFAEVYLGLGSNIGNSLAIIKEAIKKISNLKEVFDVQVSHVYETTPVVDDKTTQANYLNAVCRLQTSMSAHQLFERLCQIETDLGKTPKPKTAPRIIDIDLLFFGAESYNEPNLQIPHPRWRERLFVLIPLTDLTQQITIPTKEGRSQVNLKEYLKTFSNVHHEIIKLVE